MNRAVYIGAGLDILPAIVLSDVREFYFIDSLPTCEFGTLSYGDDRFYNKFFLANLNKIMKNNDFIQIDNKKPYLEFKHAATGQTIKYYVNTAFPEHLTVDMIHDINTCDTLIISGFIPHKVIIELMPKLEYVVGESHTVYVASDDENDDKINSVCNYLIENPNMCKYVLMREKTPYEYWKYHEITPAIKSNISLLPCKSLVELDSIRKKIEYGSLSPYT